MATSMSVQSIIILQLENSVKDDGEHKQFLFLEGITLTRSSNSSVCKMCTNAIAMLEIVPTLHENSCARFKLV